MNFIDWIKANQPVLLLVGPALTGLGIGALIGVFVKARIDAKDRLQNWFEQAYVTDGLDKCIATLLQLHFHFHCIAYQSDPPNRSYEMPMEAFTRVSDLLPAKEFYGVFSYMVREANGLSYGISSVLKRSDSLQDWAKQMLFTVNGLIEVLTNAKKDLIDARIKRKSDVYAIHKNPKCRDHTLKIQEIGRHSAKLSEVWRAQAIANKNDKLKEIYAGVGKMEELLRVNSNDFDSFHKIDQIVLTSIARDITDFVVKIRKTDTPFCSVEDLEDQITEQKIFIEMYKSKIEEAGKNKTTS